MKLSFRNQRESGQLLVTTMVLTMVLGIALAASLSLVTSNNSYTVRSQVWNSTLHVAEAGVEEAFAYINDVTVTNIAARNGFTWNSSSNAFYKLRALDTTSYYEVYVKTNSGTNSPTIISTGYVQTPVTVGYSARWLAAVSLPVPGVKYFSRTIQVATYRQPVMPKGLILKETMDCKGNKVTVDSYDNDLGEYGTTITWPLPIRVNISDAGDVVVGDSVANIGNANIKGHVWSGPKGTINIGPNGSVGDSAWVDASTKGIKPTWWRIDSNFNLPDVPVPWTGGALTPYPSGSYAYQMDSGIYEIAGNMDLSSKQMFVKGEAALWVKGNLTMDSGSYVKMNGSGYKLTLYVSGSMTLGGTWDKSIDPKDLLIFGLPSCKSVDITTGSKIEAAIYAPNADATLKGTADMRGSLTAKSAVLTGGSSFHYDESLGRRTNSYSFRPVTWREL